MWSSVIDLIDLSPSRKERRMKEYIMAMETDMDGVDCYIRKSELIRCKDCKYHYESKCENWEYISTDDDYFCKDGERKEE